MTRIRERFPRSVRCHFSSCVLVIVLLNCPGAMPLQAQEKQYGMMSVEWLVDQSDVIAIVREHQNPNEHTVLKTIKGQSESVDWSSIRPEVRSGFLDPPSEISWFRNHDQKVRLLFVHVVRGRGELLQSVSVERGGSLGTVSKSTHPDYKPYPRLGVETKLYGVTQFGELLLTEAQLLRAIGNRMNASCEPLPLRPGCGKHLGGEGELSARYASEQFPLNNDDEVYYLVVPYDTSRRDHFLAELQNGDAAEKLYAIRELAVFRDESAAKAIEDAAGCKEAREVFRFEKSSGDVVALTAADVREAANAELQKRR